MLITAAALGAVTLLQAQPAGPGGGRPEGRGGPGGGLFALFDTDRDGVISAAEISAAGEVLLALDTNQDGQITPADRPAPPAGAPERPAPPAGDAADLPPPPPHRGGPLLRLFDANQDGVISGEEIVAAPASLRLLDANGDGQITPDELPRPPHPAE